MAVLPTFQSDDRPFQQMQTKWAAIIDPLLSEPFLNGVHLTNIPIVSGSNTINTLLGRKYQGYVITGMRGAFAQVYEITNPNPAIHLVLNSSGSATIDLWVF